MDTSDKWYALDNRGGPILGSRGREFKCRQPDQTDLPHPTKSDLHSTDILIALDVGERFSQDGVGPNEERPGIKAQLGMPEYRVPISRWCAGSQPGSLPPHCPADGDDQRCHLPGHGRHSGRDGAAPVR